jgi:phage tail sheath gpL-like
MAVSFSEIPNGWRVPGVWAEVDGSAAATVSDSTAALLIGQALAAGTATRNVPIRISSAAAAITAFGRASALARMCQAWFANNQTTELWCLPVDDNGAGVAASATVTLSGTSTAAGVLSLYIGGYLVETTIPSGTAAADAAALLRTACGLVDDLPVVASGSTAATTLTHRHKGTIGNDCDIRVNYLGPEGGESTPAGLSVAIVAMASGATDPAITTAITNMGDLRFDFIGTHLIGATPLAALQAELAGRWGYLRQIYGGLFIADVDTVSNLQTTGSTENDPYTFLLGYEDSPTPREEVGAMFCARAAQRLSADPARPLTGLALIGMRPPTTTGQFTATERNSLLASGIATFTVSGGYCRIERCISTYVTNAAGVDDATWLDVQTPYTLAYILRTMRSTLASKYGSHKLANDGTRYGAGQAIVTPAVARGDIMNLYFGWEQQGLVENADAFAANLVVERNASDPNRLDVLFPPDLINQCRIFAVLAQFRLQYPTLSV